jgi:hypothetical protein
MKIPKVFRKKIRTFYIIFRFLFIFLCALSKKKKIMIKSEYSLKSLP